MSRVCWDYVWDLPISEPYVLSMLALCMHIFMHQAIMCHNIADCAYLLNTKKTPPMYDTTVIVIPDSDKLNALLYNGMR